MKLFDDLKSPFLLYLKGGLFVFLVLLTGIMIILSDNPIEKLILLPLCIWSSCRFYYFLFYVLEQYMDHEKNSSIFAMLIQIIRKKFNKKDL